MWLLKLKNKVIGTGTTFSAAKFAEALIMIRFCSRYSTDHKFKHTYEKTICWLMSLFKK